MIFRNILIALFMGATLANAETTPVTIDGAVGKLRGVLTTPDNASGKKIPMVIIFHGLTGNINETLHQQLASELATYGIASIRFDFNGHGKSDGAFRNMSLDNELEDARRIFAYTRNLPFVGDIGIVGHSQGGVISILLSGELGKKIKAVALLAPAVIIHDNMIRGDFQGVSFDPVNVPEEVVVNIPSFISDSGEMILGKEYILSGQRIQPFESAKKYKGEVLLIHGTGDRAVPYSYSQYLTYFYKKHQLELLKGIDHGFSGNEKSVAEKVTSFMAKQLK